MGRAEQDENSWGSRSAFVSCGADLPVFCCLGEGTKRTQSGTRVLGFQLIFCTECNQLFCSRSVLRNQTSSCGVHRDKAAWCCSSTPLLLYCGTSLAFLLKDIRGNVLWTFFCWNSGLQQCKMCSVYIMHIHTWLYVYITCIYIIES